MRSPDRRRYLPVLLLAGLLPLLMASRAVSSTLIVREQDVVDEDLYFAATDLRVSGLVEGDLVGSTLQSALIDGEVRGDVQIIASQVEVTGVVAGGARIVADVITVDGTIGDDAVLIGRTVRVSGSVGRDLMVWAVDAVVRGDVDREALVVLADDAVMSGHVGAGAEVIADSIRFEDGASFESGVRARSDAIDGADLVDGRVTVPSELPIPVRAKALAVTAILAGVALMIGLWLSAFWLAPTTVRAGVEIADREPGRALVNGVWVLGVVGVILVGPALIGLIGFPEAALGVYVFGGPFILLFGGIVMVAWFVGAVPAATAVGMRIARRASPLSAFIAGAVVLGVAVSIPYVRWLVTLVLTAGVGALWLGAGRHRGSTDWLRVPPAPAAGRRASVDE